VCDSGHVSLRDYAGTIIYLTEKAVGIALEAMQCCGGNGYSSGLPSSTTCQVLDDLPERQTWRLLRAASLYSAAAGTQGVGRMLTGWEFNDDYERQV